jgi:hypothetical protein
MWPSAWALAAGGDLVMTPEVEWRAAVGVGLPAAVAPDADASPFALYRTSRTSRPSDTWDRSTRAAPPSSGLGSGADSGLGA